VQRVQTQAHAAVDAGSEREDELRPAVRKPVRALLLAHRLVGVVAQRKVARADVLGVDRDVKGRHRVHVRARGELNT